jgi:hypothetical protein
MKRLYNFQLGLGLKPCHWPSLACSFPLPCTAQLRPSCHLSQSPLLLKMPLQRRCMSLAWRRFSRPCRHAVPYTMTCCSYPLDPWTRAQAVSMMNFIKIVKNPNEPTLSPILNPNQTVDQSSIQMENRFGTLFHLW